ncbi:MAG TPA: glycosyltransferase [Terracidiphilus sp.]|jgi:glycosyltransferase involved in cell wall biosynthesis
MHIAYLIPTLDRIGGAEQQTIVLATGIARRGSQVTVIALSGSGSDAANTLIESGVRFQSLQMRKGLMDPRGWLRLHRWIRANKPDVLHAHLPHAALLARWSRVFAPVPVLVDTIHSPHTARFLCKVGYRLSSRLSDVNTAVSSAAAGPWLNAHLLDRDRLVLIPNGVDLNYWKPANEHTETQPGSVIPRRFTWLTLGRLDPVKDHATLLHAFARLPQFADLILAGDGPLKHPLQTLARALGIAHRVTFVGFQKNPLSLMRQSDAFVLTSKWEGLPVALMEASACALPAIITNTPGSKEVLPQPAVCDIPVGNPNALATAMSTMMALSPSERRRLGIRARNIVADRFSLVSMLDRYDALYRDLLAVRSRKAHSLSSAPFRSNTTRK